MTERGLRRLVAGFAASMIAVALPLAAGARGAPAPSTGAASSEPVKTALTIRASAHPSGTTALRILVFALGPDDFAPATLRDAQGLATAKVSALAPGRCAGLSPHVTGVGDDAWCLEITGVMAGAELSGVLSGSRTSLALTLDARHNFVPWPLLVALGSLLLAAAVANLTAQGGLQSLRDRLRIARLLAENARADCGRITDLSEFARERRRTPLGPLLEELTSLRDGAKRLCAEIEAEREEVRGIADPALRPLQEALEELGTRLAGAAVADLKAIEDDHRELQVRLAQAKQSKAEAYAPRPAPKALRFKTRFNLAPAGAAIVLLLAVTIVLGIAFPSIVFWIIPSLLLAASGAWGVQQLLSGEEVRAAAALVLAYGFVAVFLVGSAVGAAAARWAAAPTFGTWSDYLTLGLAAAGSGAGAALVAALVILRRRA